MTVREFAHTHADFILDMMTPAGFIKIDAKKLLTDDSVSANPGCSGFDMTFDAEDVLEMKIVNANLEGTTAYLFTE